MEEKTHQLRDILAAVTWRSTRTPPPRPWQLRAARVESRWKKRRIVSLRFLFHPKLLKSQLTSNCLRSSRRPHQLLLMTPGLRWLFHSEGGSPQQAWHRSLVSPWWFRCSDGLKSCWRCTNWAADRLRCANSCAGTAARKNAGEKGANKSSSPINLLFTTKPH